MLRYIRIPALLLGLLMAGCISPQKFEERHDPDTVVKFASRRVDSKRVKTKWAKALESSFAKANNKDFHLIQLLKAQGTLTAWEEIHDINKRIQKRQARVRPLLPIVSEDGYRPDIRLLPVEDMLAESRQKVIDLSLPGIEAKLDEGRSGSRVAAREAHGRMVYLRKKYGWNEPKAKQMVDEAFELGKVYVLLDVTSRWHFFYRNNVVNYLNLWGVNSNIWQVIHMTPQPGINYDFRAELVVLDASVSPDNLTTTCSSVTETVQVGLETLTDTNGVVTYKPILQEVTATIFQATASKNATLTAEFSIYDADGNRLNSHMIRVSDNFSESFCYYTGDSRVSATNGCRTSSFVQYPTDWLMMDNCASDLRYWLNNLIDEADVR